MSLHLDRIGFSLLLVAIIFTALAHGAVEPWSVAFFEWMCVLVLLIISFKAFSSGHISLHLPATFWPMAAVLGLGLVQCCSWSNANGQQKGFSFDVEATRATVLQFFLLLVMFLAAYNWLLQRDRLEFWHRFVVVFGAALALFALVQHFSWEGKFFWLRPAVAEDITSPFGPFVHHGHYAGYVELLLPLPLALLVTREITGMARLIYLGAAILMGLSILFSLSRGGTLGLLSELAFLGIAGTKIARRFSKRSALFAKEAHFPEAEETVAVPEFIRAVLSRLGLAVFAGLILVTGWGWLSAEPLLNQEMIQASGQQFYLTRGWIWRDTLTLIKDNPLLGVGLGAYETAFPLYSRSDGSLRVNAVHNDYLQIIAETGLIGSILAVWFVAVLFRQIRRGLRSRDALRAGQALGCGAALSGVLAHSAFDFSLHLPAHALLFLVLTAIGSALETESSSPAFPKLSSPALPRNALSKAAGAL